MTLQVLLALALLHGTAGSWLSGSSGAGDFADALEGVTERVVDISPVEVEEHQKKWGDGIVAIGELLRTHSFNHVRREAQRFVDDLYGDDFSRIIVKPTGVVHKPFRSTSRGVVSWLVGHDDDFPQDAGFATRSWKRVRFMNAGISLTGNQALAMGNSFYKDHTTGEEVKGEYTMGFIRNRDGRICLNLHFSSIPFTNNTNSLLAEGISQEDIQQAQKKFVDDIVSVGRHQHIEKRVKRFSDNTFAFNEGEVLFKPPDALDTPYRISRFGVYSYFGGSSEDYPHVFSGDQGFVRQVWRHGEFENVGVVLEGDQAWAMGAYTFSKEDGRRFEAEYAIGYTRDGEGRLRINLFSASIPSEVKAPRHKRKDCFGTMVTAKAIEEAQKAWAEGIVDIGTTHATKGNYRKRAEQFVDRMYAYQIRPVLYKPADAGGRHTFRTSREGAISYFIGGDPNFPHDIGFALQGWEHVHFTNADVIYTGDEAITMGFVAYAGSNGIWRTAEITMGFILDEERNLRINLQHATFPDSVRRWQFGSVNPRGGHYRRLSQDVIEGAQQKWGHWLVRIGEAKKNLTKARILAEEMVDDMYDFGAGQVLFNVIEATNATRFRYTRRGAISFFVGNDCSFPADHGFAVKQPWSEVRFKIHGLKVMKDYRAHAFGTSYFCCDEDGKEVEVEHTMGFVADADGKPRIFLHDMARPYEAEESASLEVLGSIGHASGVMRDVSVSMGSTVRSGGTGAVMALIALPLVGGMFVYFACCWNTGKLGIGGGAAARRVGTANYALDGGGGAGYANPSGLGYGGGGSYSVPSGAGFQGGSRGGSYSRAAGSANGFAPASMGYQDSVYANQYEPVPNRGSVSPYMSGTGGSFYPQQGQQRRSVMSSKPVRGSWRTPASMQQQQRMY